MSRLDRTRHTVYRAEPRAQLMATLFVSNAQPGGAGPEDLFKVTSVCSGLRCCRQHSRGERLQDSLAGMKRLL